MIREFPPVPIIGHESHTDTGLLHRDPTKAAGTGYTAGGVALAGKTVTYTAGTNTLILDASDTQWPDSTVTGRYLILFDDTPSTDATKPLIGYIDFGADVSTTAGVFTSVWDAAGILGFTTA